MVEKNASALIRPVTNKAATGTPRRLSLPKTLGALRLCDIAYSMREATYIEEFPQDSTDDRITAFMMLERARELVCTGMTFEEAAEEIRATTVFTTHTPVPAGHDRFSTEQAIRILGGDRTARLQRQGCFHEGLLNMTMLALRFSRYANGVAMQHGKVSQQMFPDYKVYSITNGVHAATWLSPQFQDLLDEEIPHWRTDNQYLRSVYGIAPARIADTETSSKAMPSMSAILPVTSTAAKAASLPLPT